MYYDNNGRAAFPGEPGNKKFVMHACESEACTMLRVPTMTVWQACLMCDDANYYDMAYLFSHDNFSSAQTISITETWNNGVDGSLDICVVWVPTIRPHGKG